MPIGSVRVCLRGFELIASVATFARLASSFVDCGSEISKGTQELSVLAKAGGNSKSTIFD